jgi:hypothetical protein
MTSKDALALLPTQAQERIKDFIPPKLKVRIKVHPDPYVQGTFAVRIKCFCPVKKKDIDNEIYFKNGYVIDLLWYNGEFDDCEFVTWPPIANKNNLKFF